MAAENINISSHVVGPRWQAGATYEVVSSYTLASAIETGDSFTFQNLLPEDGVQVSDFELFGQEFDTNATPTATVVVGDGTDTDGYLTSKTAGGAGQQFLVKGDGALLGGTATAAGRDVVVTIGGAVATAASSGTFYVRVRYYCDLGA